mmetsp:Transcript_76364/g.181606  ORF Transcript_76364/g.181606 Transcript_76364/m.181606 type:complete len:253 (-) Transcript_76364:2240-2998(-)
MAYTTSECLSHSLQRSHLVPSIAGNEALTLSLPKVVAESLLHELLILQSRERNANADHAAGEVVLEGDTFAHATSVHSQKQSLPSISHSCLILTLRLLESLGGPATLTYAGIHSPIRLASMLSCLWTRLDDDGAFGCKDVLPHVAAACSTTINDSLHSSSGPLRATCPPSFDAPLQYIIVWNKDQDPGRYDFRERCDTPPQRLQEAFRLPILEVALELRRPRCSHSQGPKRASWNDMSSIQRRSSTLQQSRT